MGNQAWSSGSARAGLTLRAFRDSDSWIPEGSCGLSRHVGENEAKREDVVKANGMHANNFRQYLHSLSFTSSYITKTVKISRILLIPVSPGRIL